MNNPTPPVYGSNNKLLKVGSDFKHIAFIMDGNGRWATARGRDRKFGHAEGAKAFERVVRYCGNIGIQYVTVYAFSTENFRRPKEEVDEIMSLLEKYIDKVLRQFKDYDLRVRFIGRRDMLSDKLVSRMEKAETVTAQFSKTLNIALCYGGREEITHACNKLMAEGKTSVTEDDIERALYTGECPPPDLIFRTAGEIRLSNFLLWQAAYSEFYFTDVLWPDMGEDEVDKAIEAYYKRTRRFGAVK